MYNLVVYNISVQTYVCTTYHLCTTDQMKQQLALSDLSRHLLALLASVVPNTDEESISTQKLAADLIVLILTGGNPCTYLVLATQNEIQPQTSSFFSN